MTSELNLNFKAPRFKIVNGRKLFNRGHIPVLKGKTYEECYGKERAAEIRKKMSERRKGHPYYGGRDGAGKPVVIISEGRLIARFPSVKIASQKVGVGYDTAKGYLRKKHKPSNGWQWFYENDNSWYELINN